MAERVVTDLAAGRTVINQPKCWKCMDRGWYSYDHNHGKPCEECCPHDQGWWQLGEGYAHPGWWCCKRGCGYSVPEQPSLALNQPRNRTEDAP